MKKSFFIIAAMLLMTTFAIGQSTGLVVDNQSAYTVYYVLYGDNGVCDASSSSGVFSVSPYTTAAPFTSPSGNIPGLTTTDVFTMFGIYSSNPSVSTPCSTGTLQGYYTGCGALGYNAGPNTETVGTPSGSLCVNSNVTVEWQNNTPIVGYSTVLIQ